MPHDKTQTDPCHAIASDAPLNRCAWCSADPLYIQYHDEEWGVPSRDPGHLFEMLILEGFQAGLSWLTVLRKRAALRTALLDFDPQALAEADDHWLQGCLQNAAIIRHRLKLQAARSNAQAWLALPDPVALVWSVVDQQPHIHHYRSSADIPTAGPQAQTLSQLLKSHGFRFVGPTICQSYLQAIGCLMDHTRDCHRYPVLSHPSSQS